MFKLLVCGSREIKDKEFVFKALDFLLPNKVLSAMKNYTIEYGD